MSAPLLDSNNWDPENRGRDADILHITRGTPVQHTPFKLDPEFLKQFEGKQPNWGPLGYVTFKRTYARRLPNGLFEEFWQTLQRVVEGTYRVQQRHCESLKLPWSVRKANRSAQEMFQRFWDFKCLPPGRGLWMMGTEYMERVGGAALNSCAMVSTAELSTSFSSPFCFLMDMSMLGVGVSFDTKGAGSFRIREPKQSDEVHVVTDDREGWVDLIRRYLDCYSGDASLPKSVDYSLVRSKGSPIRGFGGTASGPEPLMELVSSIQDVLKPMVGEKINSTNIVDLFNLIGRCVVSGNVRRSAELSLGDINDDDFHKLKDNSALLELERETQVAVVALAEINSDSIDHPRLVEKIRGLQLKANSHPLNHHRWASNNSIVAEVGMDYTKFAESTAKNGEPGYMWLENAKAFSRMGSLPDGKDEQVVGNNPCAEMSLESYELCNLAETFPANHESYDDYQKTLKYAYLYAKTITLVPTHDARTNAVMLRNRRIGTSQAGVVQSIQKIGLRAHFDWCDRGYKYLRKLDGSYSRWLCVPESKKITTVKPGGTIPLLPGATPGMHFDHAEFYFRTIRFEKGSAIAKSLELSNYRCEDDITTPNTTVVYFPVHAQSFERSKFDVSMWEQLEIAAQLQQYWSDNQVSATITFKPEEAKDIKHALSLYETRLKSISFLPLDGGGYKQAPYITITKEEYEIYSATILPFDLSGIVHDVEDKFCDSDHCTVPQKT